MIANEQLIKLILLTYLVRFVYKDPVNVCNKVLPLITAIEKFYDRLERIVKEYN
jgi:lipid-A-disaccharide synthase-like uncharacterized protein